MQTPHDRWLDPDDEPDDVCPACDDPEFFGRCDVCGRYGTFDPEPDLFDGDL